MTAGAPDASAPEDVAMILARLEASIVDNRVRGDASIERIKFGLDSSRWQTTTRFCQVDQRLSTVADRLGRLDGTVRELSENVQRLTATIAERFDALEAHVERVAGRIQPAETDR
jgi:hypothetical protein